MPTRKSLREFALWLETQLEIIDPRYPQGKFMEDGELAAWADLYWETCKGKKS